MDDKIFDEYKSISRQVDKIVKEGRKVMPKKNFNKGRPLPSKQAARPVQPIVNAPRATATLEPRNRTFYDLVQKSRTLDQRIKQSRKAGKDVKDRIQDLEEFSKISEEMENVD